MAYSLTYSYNSSSQSYSVTGYSNITTSDKVVIPHKYDNGTNGEHPVKSIDPYAFSDCANLTSVTIPDSVMSIGGYAFNNCSSLTSVTIPNSVTSISSYAFYNCSHLTSVTIGSGVTSIGSYMFAGCANLPSVTIPDGVTSIGDSAFAGCYSLRSMTIPDSVTSIGSSAFGSCYSLTSVTIGNSVTSIGEDAFINCMNLIQLILFPSAPPTLGSTTAIPTNVQSIYVRQSSKAAYKAATNWTTFASKIIPDDMYLSLAQFNQKNKEYIDNSDSMLANSLMGSGIIGSGEPPLQGYNKSNGTIEERLTNLGFKKLQTSTKKSINVSGATYNGTIGSITLQSVTTYREGNMARLSLNISFNSQSLNLRKDSQFYEFYFNSAEATVSGIIPENYRPTSDYIFTAYGRISMELKSGSNTLVTRIVGAIPIRCTIKTSGDITLKIYTPLTANNGGGVVDYSKTARSIAAQSQNLYIGYPVRPYVSE